MKLHLAIDLGAESGRVIGVWIDGDAVEMHECYRFLHQPVALPTGLHWNVAQIWSEILKGLNAAAAWAKSNAHTVSSVGCDAWGVDWALLDKSGELLGLPHAYRDPRNPKFYEEAVGILGVDQIYQTTGIQMMPINTLYSLLAVVRTSPHVIDAADQLLFIPDLIHYWLCGVRVVERTIASTSQMIDLSTGAWAANLLQPLGIPEKILGEIVPAGTKLGKIRAEVATATGLSPDVQVITPGSHDTASAVAAVPADGSGSWCYLSSGTWSLLGAELEKHCTTAAAQAAMFTNEAGLGKSFRFLKNIAGLWLVQECRREWQRAGQDISYQKLSELAASESSISTLIDPNHLPFQQPGNMPKKIVAFARATSQAEPQTPGQFVRCILNSLALAYRRTFGSLETILGQRFDQVHIVGGGGQNTLLNQLAADAVDREVIVGPLEATAIGNGLVQAMACSELQSAGEIRSMLSRSSLIIGRFSPNPILDRTELSARFAKICQVKSNER